MEPTPKTRPTAANIPAALLARPVSLALRASPLARMDEVKEPGASADPAESGRQDAPEAPAEAGDISSVIEEAAEPPTASTEPDQTVDETPETDEAAEAAEIPEIGETPKIEEAESAAEAGEIGTAGEMFCGPETPADERPAFAAYLDEDISLEEVESPEEAGEASEPPDREEARPEAPSDDRPSWSPLPGPEAGPAASPAAFPPPAAVARSGSRWPALVLAVLIGLAVGGGAMWLRGAGYLGSEPDRAHKIEALNEERERLRAAILQATEYVDTYPVGSVPQALAVASREEYRIADTLLLQQVAALESGAKVTVEARRTRPDPELADHLKKEIDTLKAEIARQREEAQKLTEVPWVVAITNIETLGLNLGILERNYLVAKYGLNAPLPQLRSAPAEEAAAPRAEMENLTAENAALRAENEKLRASDAVLYGQAAHDQAAGNLSGAADKLRRLPQLHPDSPLRARAADDLTQIEIQAAEMEAAQKPPVTVVSAALKHDGGYFENETQVRIAFKNVSPLVIKQLEFTILTFDDQGRPVPGRKQETAGDNRLSVVLTENIPPDKEDYGLWELSDQARQVKVRLQKVEFYDTDPWVDEDIDAWADKEAGRYTAGGN